MHKILSVCQTPCHPFSSFFSLSRSTFQHICIGWGRSGDNGHGRKYRRESLRYAVWTLKSIKWQIEIRQKMATAAIKITCPSAGNCNQRVISANVNLITVAATTATTTTTTATTSSGKGKQQKEQKNMQQKEQALSPPARDRAAHCAQCARTGKLTQQCWLINGTSSSSSGVGSGGFFYNSTKVEQIIKKQCAKRTRGLDDSAAWHRNYGVIKSWGSQRRRASGSRGCKSL